jgi:hypothetical protein
MANLDDFDIGLKHCGVGSFLVSLEIFDGHIIMAKKEVAFGLS